MECFRLLFDHLTWIEHQFLSGIRDSRKPGSLWGMIRDVRGVRKSIHQSWLAKRLGLGLLCWGFKGVREEIPWEEDSTLQIGSVAFISHYLIATGSKFLFWAQGIMHQDNAPVHNSILVTDYLTKMGIKTVPQLPYNPEFALCDFWLFPKLTGCRYKTIEGHRHAHTRRLPWAFQKLLERYNKCIAAGGDQFEGD